MAEHPLEQFRKREAKRRGERLPRYQFASEIGCSPARYTQIVLHRQSPSVALAKRIKALTGLTFDKLLEAAQ